MLSCAILSISHFLCRWLKKYLNSDSIYISETNNNEAFENLTSEFLNYLKICDCQTTPLNWKLAQPSCW